jgi:hypothetical protein
MTTTFSSAHSLSDRDLLAQLDLAVRHERHATVQVIALLMEVDARKLYAQQSCSSLFTYCVQVLHFSEHAAYLRIEAARAARRFPAILDRLAEGSIHLSGVSLLAPHLAEANHVEMLDAARYKSKRQVEQLIARLRPQPDVPAVVRKLPTPHSQVSTLQPTLAPPTQVATGQERALASASGASGATPPVRAVEIKPLAPERFKVQFTVGRETYEKLRQAQDLLRHAIPNGDPAAIFDRALTLLLEDSRKGNTPRRISRDAAARPRPALATFRRTSSGQCGTATEDVAPFMESGGDVWRPGSSSFTTSCRMRREVQAAWRTLS